MRLFRYLLLIFLISCEKQEQKYFGYVEADYEYVAPTSPGILYKLSVKRGDYVNKGDLLFALEDTGLRATIENSKMQIIQDQAILADSYKEFKRAKNLVETGAISRSEFDTKNSLYNVHQAKLAISQQNLLVAEQTLKDSMPVAKQDSFVEDTFFIPGEFVPSGSAVVSLLSPENIKIRFFIPQNELEKFAEGKKISFSCDGSEVNSEAIVSFIAKEAEYTPPVIYSNEARQKMVFMVEARPKNYETPCLHPGLPVNIEVAN